jgi:hypothetical protein
MVMMPNKKTTGLIPVVQVSIEYSMFPLADAIAKLPLPRNDPVLPVLAFDDNKCDSTLDNGGNGSIVISRVSSGQN